MTTKYEYDRRIKIDNLILRFRKMSAKHGVYLKNQEQMKIANSWIKNRTWLMELIFLLISHYINEKTN